MPGELKAAMKEAPYITHRGEILPLADYSDGSWGFAAPQLAKDVWDGISMVHDAYTGDLQMPQSYRDASPDFMRRGLAAASLGIMPSAGFAVMPTAKPLPINISPVEGATPYGYEPRDAYHVRPPTPTAEQPAGLNVRGGQFSLRFLPDDARAGTIEGHLRDSGDYEIDTSYLGGGIPTGQGVGRRRYYDLADWLNSQGKTLYSDQSLSKYSRGVYEKLLADGYNVRGPFNNGKSIYEVRPMDPQADAVRQDYYSTFPPNEKAGPLPRKGPTTEPYVPDTRMQDIFGRPQSVQDILSREKWEMQHPVLANWKKIGAAGVGLGGAAYASSRYVKPDQKSAGDGK